MELLLSSALFILGLMLIIKGGDLFVDAAAWIARVSGIPQVIVGATIVSLATTLPEILVSLLAATQGKADMAIGNAVGSVTANQGLILGASLLFAPLTIRRKDYATRGLLMVAAVGALLLFSTSGTLTLPGSLLLFGIFAISMIDSIRTARRSTGRDAGKVRPDRREITGNVIKFVLGTVGIVWGADLLVDHGSILALELGIPESVIGVTLVAVGTSLPELVTAIASLVKKEGSLSAGNIIGANLIDTTLILPLCTLISGQALTFSSQSLLLDLPVCLLISVVTILPALVQKKFARWQGVALLGIYLAYLIVVIA